MFHCANCWSRAGRAGPSQTPSIAIWRHRLHVGTSVLIGGGPLWISEKSNIGQITITNPKQVKQGTVLCGPAGLAVFSCGIRFTPLEGSDRQLLLAKDSKKPSVGSVSQTSGPFRKGTSLAICYYLVLSGKHIVTSIFQLISVLPL